MVTTRRVMILADGDNTFLAAQSFSRKIISLALVQKIQYPGEIEIIYR
ncbi:MAG: hypothetical protein PUP90_22930 [Nostoc sp. S4]|nr:hypothetical protein [Nostoc sp. S4]